MARPAHPQGVPAEELEVGRLMQPPVYVCSRVAAGPDCSRALRWSGSSWLSGAGICTRPHPGVCGEARIRQAAVHVAGGRARGCCGGADGAGSARGCDRHGQLQARLPALVPVRWLPAALRSSVLHCAGRRVSCIGQPLCLHHSAPRAPRGALSAAAPFRASGVLSAGAHASLVQ